MQGNTTASRRSRTPARCVALVLAVAAAGGCAPRGADVDPRRPGQPGYSAISPASGPARFLVTAVAGTGYIRSASTGRVIARIKPPARYFRIGDVAVAPGDRMFYLAGWVGTAPANVKIEIFKFTLGENGRPGPARRLPGPALIDQMPGISGGTFLIPLGLSPDGRQLAYASPDYFMPDYSARHGAYVVIQNISTGRRRIWHAWPASDTVINSVSWAGPNRLGFVGLLGNAAISGGSVLRRSNHDVSVVMVLNTAAPGSSLVADSRLVVHGPVIASNVGGVALTGPAAGVMAPDGRHAYVLLVGRHLARLVRISLATGKITKVLLSRAQQTYQGEPSAIDGSYLLILLGPRRPPRPAPRFVCGHLAGIALPSDRIRVLPIPLSCSSLVPAPVVVAGW